MNVHDVRGGGGLRLHVREWGRRNGRTILFIHGWSQCHLCWAAQYESSFLEEFRLAALDLRGHGMSEKPIDMEHYTSEQLWADDIAAVIAQLDLQRPTLVGWSYGGFVICDYLRAYGEEKVAAINFVGGAVRLGEDAFGSLIGPGFLNPFAELTAEDLPTNIAGLRKFVRGLTRQPLSSTRVEEALCSAMVVPAAVRLALANRRINGDDVLRGLSLPVLVSHGRDDTVVLPAMAEQILSVCSAARASWYRDTGHAPHLEDPTRFNDELGRFVHQAPTGP